MKKKKTTLIVLVLIPALSFAQPLSSHLSLKEAIDVARAQSVPALQARQAFISTYWSWRSYQASRLPSLTLYGSLMNFNRSLTLLQSYEDGSLRYTATNNLQNSLGLQLAQNLPFSGGTLYVYSDLSRIDQFGRQLGLTWYSQPVTVSLVQPLFSYNRFKWEKQIEPKEYERGRRTYLESMESLSLQVVEAYFDLLLAKRSLEAVREGYSHTDRMCRVARERLSLGSVTRDELLQLELQLLRDSVRISEGSVEVRKTQMALNSLLGYDESREVIPVLEDDLPVIDLTYEEVLSQALSRSTLPLENEIDLLTAESSVAKAKADRGISMSLNARFGLSQSAPDFAGAYKNPLNQEIVGLGFSIPLFDWGLGRGKVQKALAAEEVVRARVEQRENTFRRELFMTVGQFENQGGQCSVSRRAKEIAAERYSLMMERFRAGTATVTDLITAQKDYDASVTAYITDVKEYWRLYYTIRRCTLYDYQQRVDLEVNMKEML